MMVEYNRNSNVDGLYIETVIVMGVRTSVANVYVNNSQSHSAFIYNTSTKVKLSRQVT